MRSFSVILVFSFVVSAPVYSQFILKQKGDGKTAKDKVQELQALDRHDKGKKIRKEIRKIQSEISLLQGEATFASGPARNDLKRRISLKNAELDKAWDQLLSNYYSKDGLDKIRGILRKNPSLNFKKKLVSKILETEIQKLDQEERRDQLDLFKKVLKRYPKQVSKALSAPVELLAGFPENQIVQTMSKVHKVNLTAVKTLMEYPLGHAMLAAAASDIMEKYFLNEGQFSRRMKRRLKRKYAYAFRGKESRRLNKASKIMRVKTNGNAGSNQ